MPVSALSIKTIISMKDKRTILSSVLCAVALAFGSTAYATTLTIGDSRDLGLISPNHPANPANSETNIDILLAQPSPSGPTTIGANKYTRTANDRLGGVYLVASFVAERCVATAGGGANSVTIDHV